MVFYMTWNVSVYLFKLRLLILHVPFSQRARTQCMKYFEQYTAVITWRLVYRHVLRNKMYGQ